MRCGEFYASPIPITVFRDPVWLRWNLTDGRPPGSILQERPCTRCIKRNIGHLCRDEPRESDRKTKGEHRASVGGDDRPSQQNELLAGPGLQGIPSELDQNGSSGSTALQDGSMGLRSTTDLPDAAVIPPNSSPPVNQTRGLDTTNPQASETHFQYRILWNLY